MQRLMRTAKVSGSVFFIVLGFSFLCANGFAGEEVIAGKNKKGKVDRWTYIKAGEVVKREYDKNGDGKADLRVIESKGRLIRKEYDVNFDGSFDKTEYPLAHGTSGRIKTMNTDNPPKI